MKCYQALFAELGVTLIDFKLEFGKDADGNILLADEISPDTCRLMGYKRRMKSLIKMYSVVI